MNDDNQKQGLTLIVSVQERLCALPLAHIIETMRPLPVEPMAQAPSFVLGVSVIRGVPTPVVELGALLGVPHADATRFVTLRPFGRQVAVSVGAVLGVRHLDPATIQQLPPLLQNGSKDFIDAIGTLDARLLSVLRESLELPEDVWQVIGAREAIG